jgi:hypothetical protein
MLRDTTAHGRMDVSAQAGDSVATRARCETQSPSHLYSAADVDLNLVQEARVDLAIANACVIVHPQFVLYEYISQRKPIRLFDRARFATRILALVGRFRTALNFKVNDGLGDKIELRTWLKWLRFLPSNQIVAFHRQPTAAPGFVEVAPYVSPIADVRR